MGTCLVEVPFHGDTLHAVQDDKGVWVSVRRVCEALGIARESQQAKLKKKGWAVGTFIVLTGPDGKQYENYMLHLDSLPMWLATIETSRVKPGIREKLEVYQREAAKVLARHFLGEPRRDTALSATDIMKLVSTTLRETMPSMVRETLQALPAPAIPMGQLVSIDDRLRRRWPGISPEWKRRVRDVARDFLDRRRGKQPWKNGEAVNAQFLFERDDMDCIDDAIDKVQEEARRREEPLDLFLSR